MKAAAIVFFSIAILGIFSLVQMNSGPSAFVVQPSDDRVLGYCPVNNAGQACFIGGREGVCSCQTLDQNMPLYWQRKNCNCVIPSYIAGVWPNP